MVVVKGPGGPPGSEQPQGWRARLRTVRTVFRGLPRTFRLVWDAHRPGAIGMVLVTLLMAVLPAAQAWAGKLIIDAVVLALGSQATVEASLRAVLPFLALEFGLITAGALLGEGRQVLEHIVGARLRHSIKMSIIRKALALDLHYFEDAAFYDKMQNAQREAGFRGLMILNNSFMLLQNVISLASFAVILLTFSPLITLLLFGATLPAFVAQVRHSNEFFGFQMGHTPDSRRMIYLENLLTMDTSVKEIKLFNLGKPLLKRYEELFWRFYHGETALVQRRSLRSTLWGLLSSASYYLAYGWIVWRTIAGAITLGDMTLYLALCRQAQGTFQGLFFNVSQLYENGLFMENLFDFLGLQPQERGRTTPRRVPRPIRTGIEFRNVSFRYPGREDWALHDVSLRIGPGEKLALVGANGAGKTTFVKLLTRLYDPTEGQILLDGVDLREYDLDDLRERIGVIFQDFVHYHATARENIGFGQIAALEDEPRLVAAAQRGGADEVVAALPQGYETMLGRWFDRGHELSGGQWQKMALGRAFMRDGEVLVLDEPTAALDAEHEYEIFQRFRELTAGKIALLISHRFSTVRMADRIAVLEGGRLIELGDHHQLLALDGTYARLFSMQAEGYR